MKTMYEMLANARRELKSATVCLVVHEDGQTRWVTTNKLLKTFADGGVLDDKMKVLVEGHGVAFFPIIMDFADGFSIGIYYCSATEPLQRTLSGVTSSQVH